MYSTLKDTSSAEQSPAYEWLSSFTKYGWIFGLDRILYLLDRLGNPHREFQVVHVTGTNGKGSVCRYISSILQKAGFTVGVYLSPHIERFSERIVVNGEEISEKDLEDLVGQVRPIAEEMMRNDKPPTFFEIVTALAFLYFRNRKVEYAVVEVGLGGRFDATNVLTPLVSVITNISLEHTNILGSDIASIAFEKAGIIKDHVPVVTAATAAARDTIKAVALEKDAPIIIIGKPLWKRLYCKKSTQEFFIHGAFKDYKVKTTLLGLHQGENIAVAIAAVERLQMSGVYISDDDIVQGIVATTHPGRMELISEAPRILLDGAHNPDGMRVLAKTLKHDFTYDRLLLILGVLKDKDITMMISTILPLADCVIVTQSTNPRSFDPALLREKIQGFDLTKETFVEATIPRAVDRAKHLAKRKDLICISGSLFTVGEARQYLLTKNKKIGEHYD